MGGEGKVFVGREEELRELQEAIDRPEGQLLLVVGGPGYGKSALLEKLEERLYEESGKELTYFPFRYLLNPGDTAELFFPILMHDIGGKQGPVKYHLLRKGARQEEQWKEFLGIAADALAEFAPSTKTLIGAAKGLFGLMPKDVRSVREILRDFLAEVSGKMKEYQRLVVICDPQLNPDDDLDTSIAADLADLLRYLPSKVKLVFSQRQEDCLIQSELINRSNTTRKIPKRQLGHLTIIDSNELIDKEWLRRANWQAFSPTSPDELKEILWDKYKGYALALTIALEELLDEPMPIDELLVSANEMPQELLELLRRRYRQAAKSEEAVVILRALAIYSYPIMPSRLAELCCSEQISRERVVSALADTKSLRCCIITDVKGAVYLFHSTFASVIKNEITEERAREIHFKAAKLFASDLSVTISNMAALEMLPYHLYYAGKEDSFLSAIDAIGGEKQRLRLWRSWKRDLEWALPICRAKAKSGAIEDETELACTIANLGLALDCLGEYQLARAKYEESLDIWQLLVKENPELLEPNLASVLGNLAILLRKLGELEESCSKLHEVLNIHRRLAQRDPITSEPVLASSLANIGCALGELGKYYQAKEAFEEAIQTFRQLQKQEPGMYLPGLGTALSNFCPTLAELGEFEKAEKIIEEALAIRSKLAALEPDAYEPDFAETLINFGELLRRQKRWTEAIDKLERAIPIYKRLEQNEPKAYGEPLLVALSNLGDAFYVLGDRQQALTKYKDSLVICRRLAVGMDIFKSYLAATLCKIGMMLSDQGNWCDAKASFEESLDIFSQLVQKEPQANLPKIVKAVNSILTSIQKMGGLNSDWPALQNAVGLIHHTSQALDIKLEVKKISY